MATYTKPQYIGLLRKFLRDIDELNKLLDRKESSDNQLEMALDMALDDWNTSSPILYPSTFANFPAPNLLIRGAAIQILTSVGVLYSRNKLDYSDGGITVRVSDQAQEYLVWLNMIVNDYERKKLEFKKFYNIAACWGNVYSEYSQINLGRW